MGKLTIIIIFFIRCKFLFLFIGREYTTWPENNCLQIMVCSANTGNILLVRKWNHAFLLLAIALAWKWQSASLPEDIHKKKNKLGDRMIKQLLNSSIARCRDLSVSRRSIIGLSLRLHNWRHPFYLVEINIMYWGARSRVSKNIWTIRWARFASALTNHLAPVVQTLDSTIHRINHYPPDKSLSSG